MPLRPTAPLVSVIIPTLWKTRAPYLEEALRSVRAQTLEDWEAIVVSDEPSRGCEAAVKKILGGKGVFIAAKTMGAGPARNAAIARSRGEFIAFLDDDDVWLPRKLEKQVEFMVRSGARFSYTNYEIMSRGGDDACRASLTPAAEPFRKFGFDIYPMSSTVMLRKSALERLEEPAFDENFRKTHEDTDLWLRFYAAHGKGEMTFCGGKLTRYRIHSGRMTPSRPLADLRARLDDAWLMVKLENHCYCSPRSHVCGKIFNLPGHFKSRRLTFNLKNSVGRLPLTEAA